MKEAALREALEMRQELDKLKQQKMELCEEWKQKSLENFQLFLTKQPGHFW